MCLTKWEVEIELPMKKIANEILSYFSSLLEICKSEREEIWKREEKRGEKLKKTKLILREKRMHNHYIKD